MNNIIYKSTTKTPYVCLDADKGHIELYGKSICEDTNGFYKPIIQWTQNFLHTSDLDLNFKIKLEYFNSRSSKCLMDLFKVMDLAYCRGKKIEIHWFCEDDDVDMLEAAEDYQAITNIPIKIMESENKLF